MSDEMKEMKTFREVPRPPEHCGKPMRKMQNASAVSGALVTVYVCECGQQVRPS